jgi:hypothetical protein
MKDLRATFDSLSLKELAAWPRSLLAASAHKDLLAGINTSLVLFDSILINTGNGEYRQVYEDAGSSRAEQIALSARDLLQGREPPASILLLLPATDFVATRFAMGISGEKMLRSALKLQAHTLVPACEEELLLGVNGGSSEGVALWLPARTTNALFAAFQEQGLFLAAVMPRTLALAQTANGAGTEQLLVDEDASHITQVVSSDGVLKTLLSISRIDLQQEEFAAQWQAESNKLASASRIRSEGQDFWTGLRQLLQGVESYCFFPAGAELSGRKLVARKQKTIAGGAAIVLLLLLFIPFVTNWVEIRRLEGLVATLREQSTEARQNQAAVYEMEEEWGAVSEFPRQDIGQILLSLNELMDSSLSSFAINKGVVDITGFAQDPALLIEQLAEREAFYNVGQSRSSSGGNSASRGDRFGIRFSISGIDFPGYEQKYQPSQQ